MIDKLQANIRKIRDLVYSIADIHGGAALGLLTMALAWAMWHGKDVGVGSAACYSAAIAAFAYSNVNGPKS